MERTLRFMGRGSNVTSSFVHSDFETNIPDSTLFPDIIHYNMPDSLQTIVDKWNCSDKVISVGNIKNRMGHIDLNGNTYTPPGSTLVGELSYSSSMVQVDWELLNQIL